MDLQRAISFEQNVHYFTFLWSSKEYLTFVQYDYIFVHIAVSFNYELTGNHGIQ